jgi:signal transduction histidine kinase
VPAIRQRVAAFEAGEHGLRVDVEAPDDLGELPAAVEVAAYRIVTEAVTNAARHAGAQTCSVRLTLNGTLEIEVSDDGQGVDGPVTAGVGLTSLRERAEELDGSWAVTSSRHDGTKVTASLPVAPR